MNESIGSNGGGVAVWSLKEHWEVEVSGRALGRVLSGLISWLDSRGFREGGEEYW